MCSLSVEHLHRLLREPERSRGAGSNARNVGILKDPSLASGRRHSASCRRMLRVGLARASLDPVERDGMFTISEKKDIQSSCALRSLEMPALRRCTQTAIRKCDGWESHSCVSGDNLGHVHVTHRSRSWHSFQLRRINILLFAVLPDPT